MRKLFLYCGLPIFWIFVLFVVFKCSAFFQREELQNHVLHLFTWPEMIADEIIEGFEQETGTKVVRHYYTSNEELLVKINAHQGKGYDLIIPSDYAVEQLIKEDLLEPIDYSQLNLAITFYPHLMNQAFDPGNQYSLPLTWEILGFGVGEKLKQCRRLEWDDIFRYHEDIGLISMVNDPIEAIDITARYLFGTKETLSDQDLALLRYTLGQQKTVVEAYAGVRGDYLLITDNVSLAVIPSSYALRASSQNPNIRFVLPKNYTFLSIENLCIPKTTGNKELAYLFLNYLYQIDILAKEINTFQNFPSVQNMDHVLPGLPLFKEVLKDYQEYTGEFFYTRQLLSEKESRLVWVQTKARS